MTFSVDIGSDFMQFKKKKKNQDSSLNLKGVLGAKKVNFRCIYRSRHIRKVIKSNDAAL